jgi:hypothetical protein
MTMRSRFVALGQVGALVILLALGLPIPSEADVFWTDDFENRLMPNWDTTACFAVGVDPAPDGCNASISTDIAHGGDHSLKSHYDATCGMTSASPGCGRYYDRSIPNSDEIWFRFYYYTVNFATFDLAGTKHMLFSPLNLYPNYWLVTFPGSRDMAFAGQNIQDCVEGPTSDCYTSTNFVPNVASKPLNDNQWYCVEGHLLLNQPGQANGLIQVFVDGTKTVEYANWRIRGPNVSNPNNNSSTATFQYVRHYTQYGQGDKYIDDLAIGNTRIGCRQSGSTPQPAQQ